jgi:hypothetical protein
VYESRKGLPSAAPEIEGLEGVTYTRAEAGICHTTAGDDTIAVAVEEAVVEEEEEEEEEEEDKDRELDDAKTGAVTADDIRVGLCFEARIFVFSKED